MIPFACNFAFSLWKKKIFAAPFLILDMIYIDCKPKNTAHSERGQKQGDLLANSSPSVTLIMPSECYISLVWFFFRSLSSLDPQKWDYSLQDVDQAAGDVVAVGEDPHLQSAVCSTGEDAVAGPRLHLHDAGTDVAEDGLLGVFSAERVHEPMAG